MNKTYLLTLNLCLIVAICQAQSSVRLFYLADGLQTIHADSADYFCDFVIQGDTIYKFTAYEKSGQRRAEGYSLSPSPQLKKSYQYRSYHANQQRHQTGYYTNDQKVGVWHTFYPSGELQEIGVWKKNPRPNELPFRYELVSFLDTAGHLSVIQGHGKAVTYYENGTSKETGNFREGLKDSVWTGYYPDGRKEYEETYLSGVLQQGISYDKRGQAYRYQVLEEPVRFGESQQDLYRFLAQSMRYPVAAQRARIQGKVLLSLKVDKDGTPYQVQVHSSPDETLTEEALRVLSYSKGKWKPGVKRGQVKDDRFQFPISFILE
ncbi:TonB family protein [Siphonobacter sp.]|uniref:TonB family protein n=1 Tax=Siphonobacter sp. TaxID=1869184 RepID=UPI003B3A5CA8